MTRALLLATLSAVLPTAHAQGADATVLTNLSSVIEACRDLANTNRAFAFEANLLAYVRRPITHEWILTVHADGDGLQVYELNRPGQPAVTYDAPRLNDRIRLTGVLYAYQGKVHPGYQSAACLARQPLGPTDEIVPDDFQRDDRLYRPGRMTGVVRDVFRDESDPKRRSSSSRPSATPTISRSRWRTARRAPRSRAFRTTSWSRRFA